MTQTPASSHHPRAGDPTAWERLQRARRPEMERLARALQRRAHDASSLLDLMGRVSRQAVVLIPGVDWAGVTAQWPPAEPMTISHTDENVLIIDEHQYRIDDGPCLRAMRTGSIVRMNASEVIAIWPELGHAAGRLGVVSFLALPLRTSDVAQATAAVGAFNLYSSNPTPPDPEPDVLTILTAYLQRGLTDYNDSMGADPLDREFHRVLSEWTIVDRAAQVLIATQGFDKSYAHEVIRDEAEDWHRSLVEHAHYIVHGHLPPASS